MFLAVLLWHLVVGVVILVMWVAGAVLWAVELVVMTLVAIILYSSYALPEAWQWLPCALLLCCTGGDVLVWVYHKR